MKLMKKIEKLIIPLAKTANEKADLLHSIKSSSVLLEYEVVGETWSRLRQVFLRGSYCVRRAPMICKGDFRACSTPNGGMYG